MRTLRKILFPFSGVYYLVTLLRNFFYDNGILKSKSYDIPIVAIGNLNVGGTGKSPLVEYMVKLLKDKYKLATLSRGYRRKTKGYVLASIKSTVNEIGDEPLQIFTKFKNDITVAVDEDRQHGISKLQEAVQPSLILLDDAFQHRKVKADYYIMLTKFDDLFVDDYLLPAGNLREGRYGAKRASAIIVTKCPKDLTDKELVLIKNKIAKQSHQSLFFSSIKYADFIVSKNDKIKLSTLKQSFTLVTGIANALPLVNHLKNLGHEFDHLNYKDHHNFTDDEIKVLSIKEFIITTEKDFMRLKDRIDNCYYLSIETAFLNNESKTFDDLVLKWAESKK